MRVFVYLGQVALIAALGALALAIWSLVLARGDISAVGRLPALPLGALAGGGAGAGAAGPPAEGALEIASGGQRAEIRFADGRQVRVVLPDGHWLDPKVSRLDPETVSLGVWPAAGRPFFVLISLTEGLGTATLKGKLAFYERVARQMRVQGSIGASGERVPVTEIRHDARGLFYCMQRGARLSLTGARLRRGVFVVVVLRDGCGPPGEADIARLDSVVLGVSPERWR